jgi:hypothetical protein
MLDCVSVKLGLSLRGEHKLSVFEDNVMRRIFLRT